MNDMVFLLAFAFEVRIYRFSDWGTSVLLCTLDLKVPWKVSRESTTTRKPHALDSAALALETLGKSGMLGGLSGAIQSFDDY